MNADQFSTSVQKLTTNLSEDFMEESLEVVNGRFKAKFEDHHRRLKASIHQCQMNAYAKPGWSLEKSESMARECMLPLLLVRRHAQTLVGSATDKYDDCLQRNEEFKGQAGYNKQKMGCLKMYTEELKGYVPQVN